MEGLFSKVLGSRSFCVVHFGTAEGAVLGSVLGVDGVLPDDGELGFAFGADYIVHLIHF